MKKCVQENDIFMGRATDVKIDDYSQCLEAFFFNKDEELHIYRDDDGELRGVITSEEEQDVCVDRYYKISPTKRITDGSILVKKEILEPDEDGQMCVVASRLYDIREGE